uniref:DUF4005 domain-containing protein n=1 Tax=Tanacetum cinerariifolium TaxID=118510 RepID=A0A6L2MH04_TANCI|nr:hypothetical protein [Tanacetum cinerariifolium]
MWKNSAKSANPMFLDPNNPHWGWSWLERWMAARPWETQSMTDNNSPRGDMAKRVSHHSPSTPPSRAQSSSSKVRPESQKGSVDDDSRSYYSVQSDRNRRHSVTSSVRDDESLDSSPAVPSYMAATKSTRARSRMASPVQSPSPLGSGRKGTSEKGSAAGSAKKRLSFTGSPARTTKSLEHMYCLILFVSGARGLWLKSFVNVIGIFVEKCVLVIEVLLKGCYVGDDVKYQRHIIRLRGTLLVKLDVRKPVNQFRFRFRFGQHEPVSVNEPVETGLEKTETGLCATLNEEGRILEKQTDLFDANLQPPNCYALTNTNGYPVYRRACSSGCCHGWLLLKGNFRHLFGLFDREGAVAEKVREAHRRVMVANHPDAGGSHYLASKINEAKDVMLGKTKNTGSAF